eukprot:15469054-Alexandrium_andersonii.AAC.1
MQQDTQHAVEVNDDAPQDPACIIPELRSALLDARQRCHQEGRVAGGGRADALGDAVGGEGGQGQGRVVIVRYSWMWMLHPYRA